MTELVKETPKKPHINETEQLRKPVPVVEIEELDDEIKAPACEFEVDKKKGLVFYKNPGNISQVAFRIDSIDTVNDPSNMEVQPGLTTVRTTGGAKHRIQVPFDKFIASL